MKRLILLKHKEDPKFKILDKVEMGLFMRERISLQNPTGLYISQFLFKKHFKSIEFVIIGQTSNIIFHNEHNLHMADNFEKDHPYSNMGLQSCVLKTYSDYPTKLGILN